MPEVTHAHARLIEELDRRFRSDARLRLDVAGSDSLATWFIGPKGENADILARLAATALKGNVADRQSYQPTDPPWVTPEIKKTPASSRRPWPKPLMKRATTNRTKVVTITS